MFESAEYSTDEIHDVLNGDSALDQLALDSYQMQDCSTTLSVLDSLVSTEPEVNEPDDYEPATVEEIDDIPGYYYHNHSCVYF